MNRIHLICASVFLAFGLLFSTADAQRNAPPPKPTDQTVIGWVTDSICGVKGATHAHYQCMQDCIAKGADIVVVADDTHDVVHIENPADLKSHFAQRVMLTGYFSSGQFHVISVRTI